jgi:hypothetical protein
MASGVKPRGLFHRHSYIKIKTMKKLFIISAIAISGLIYNTADAQMRFHVGIGFRPRAVVYAHAPIVVRPAVYVQTTPVYTEPAVVYNQPAVTYDQPQPAYNNTADDYYYLPDVDAYYDVNDQCYYYYNGGSWISAAYLPGAYANFDWRTAAHYEIRAPRPYLNDNVYRNRYNGHAASFAQANYNNRANSGYANNAQRAFSQPSNQNRDTRGGSEHFAQSSPQNGAARNRMSKF